MSLLPDRERTGEVVAMMNDDMPAGGILLPSRPYRWVRAAKYGQSGVDRSLVGISRPIIRLLCRRKGLRTSRSGSSLAGAALGETAAKLEFSSLALAFLLQPTAAAR
jgi:hypothetical protein